MAEINYIQVTRICNQNCRYCSNPVNGSIAPFEKVVDILRKYAETNSTGVIFTGGEPTLYPYLPEAIRCSVKLGIPARIITNGLMCSDLSYISTLKKSGLSHIHFSIHSHRKDLHEYITRTAGSFDELLKAIENAGKIGIRADITTVINKYNSKELHLLAEFIIKNFPFVRHIVFNNLDPGEEQPIEDLSAIPVFSEFEASLAKAMRMLDNSGRTFRVEWVPLCFMSEFPHCSTETRKMVKNESRTTFFLDDRDVMRQPSWKHIYTERCSQCGAKPICAGLFMKNTFYRAEIEELCPIFFDVDAVRKKILSD